LPFSTHKGNIKPRSALALFLLSALICPHAFDNIIYTQV